MVSQEVGSQLIKQIIVGEKMIGAIISMKFIGRKPWLISILFWFVYLILMSAIVFGTTGLLPIPFLSLALSILVFCALAHYWLKFPWIMALKLFAVAFLIDLLIMAIIIFAFAGWMVGYLMPSLQGLEVYFT